MQEGLNGAFIFMGVIAIVTLLGMAIERYLWGDSEEDE